MSARGYIENRWNLDCDKHKAAIPANVLDLEKKRFAYRIWSEDFEKSQKREDRKKSEIKDTWTDVYQMIGFDNVFQGVWFQGVTQLAAQRGCSFSIIPITLSLLVSVATIVGVHVKLSKVRTLQIAQFKDRLNLKVRESYITACELDGVNFDFDTIEKRAKDPVENVKNIFLADLAGAYRIRVIVLVLLTIASALFALLIHLIMCGKYH